MSIRLDPKTDQLLEQLARKRGTSRSSVVRAAIIALSEKEKQKSGPYEQIEHLIGCVGGGPKQLSTQAGKRFRELLANKQRRQ